MIINLDQLKEILDLARDHELSELEIEQEGMRLRIRRDGLVGHVLAAPPLAAAVPAPAPPGPSAVAGSPVASEAGVAGDSEIELAVVKSPIVGTFYRSSEPGAPPFVEVGTTVKKGQVLCIIEAMKRMNEIDSEFDGEIVNIYVEAGQPVQYGERLFAIRTR